MSFEDGPLLVTTTGIKESCLDKGEYNVAASYKIHLQ